MRKPLAIDLCSGLGGWTDGLLAEGWDCVGYDVERHKYGSHQYPAQLVLQDILTLDGRQFRGYASLIVASPPCQEFSYMAMPWTRAKQMAAALRGQADFPDGYTGSRTVAELTALFDACVRIGLEAGCPVVIENVRGAQPWVGRSRWNYGSFHLWGDVPALMPITKPRAKVPQFAGFDGGVGFNVAAVRAMKADDSVKVGGSAGDDWFTHHNRPEFEERATKNSGGSWFVVAHNTKSGKGQNPDGRKHGGDWFRDPSSPGRQGGVTYSGTKQPGISGERDNGKGDRWFQDGAARHGSKSSARKAASARIAKIPEALARHVARVYLPK